MQSRFSLVFPKLKTLNNFFLICITPIDGAQLVFTDVLALCV